MSLAAKCNDSTFLIQLAVRRHEWAKYIYKVVLSEKESTRLFLDQPGESSRFQDRKNINGLDVSL